MRIRSVVVAGLLGLVVAAGVGAPARPVAAASDQGWTETADTTYALDPAKGVLHVAVSVLITNTRPDTTSPIGVVTTWYLTTATIWVENEATHVRATSGGTRLATAMGSRGAVYQELTATYPKLFYPRSRTIVITYDVPGGAPRSSTDRRVLRAYASFCAIANGIDGGTVRVSVPAGYVLDTTGSTLVPSTEAGGRQVFTSGHLLDTSRFWTCFSGTNNAGYRVETFAASGGRTVRLESWPEDTRWAREVKAEVTRGIPALEKLVGRPVPGTAPIVIREDATGTEYAGFYDADTNTVTVGEDYGQPALVDHELAHTWFNLSAFGEHWIDEGSAEWAGRLTSGEAGPCAKPAAGVEVNLSDWLFLSPKSTRADRDAVDVEYETACYVVTKVADAAGHGPTIAALDALFRAEDPYAANPSSSHRGDKVATWRDWLDAMDELAILPAGASDSLASDLLLAYGVTDDRAELADREAARAAYHGLLTQVQGWVLPAAVRVPMARWDFAAASRAIAAAGSAWQLTGETDQALAGIDARHGPAALAWAAATTVDDLVKAGQLAQAQLDAARDVAAAQALAATPLDPVSQVGLVGTAIPSLDAAVAAVRSGDTATARRLAASVRDTVGALHGTGQVRVTEGGVAVVVLLVVLIAVLLVWRSRRRRSRVAAGAVAMAMAVTATDATPPSTGAVSPEPLIADATSEPPATGPSPDWPQPPPSPSPLAPPPPPGPPIA